MCGSRSFNASTSLGVHSSKILNSKQEENPVIGWGDTWWTNKKKHRNKDYGKNFFQYN